jgi:hypothetical protein
MVLSMNVNVVKKVSSTHQRSNKKSWMKLQLKEVLMHFQKRIRKADTLSIKDKFSSKRSIFFLLQ